jgi:hypothetical protein
MRIGGGANDRNTILESNSSYMAVLWYACSKRIYKESRKMKKTILVIGDSFSVGEGADFPGELHGMRDNYYEDHLRLSADYNSTVKQKKQPSDDQEIAFHDLFVEFIDWRRDRLMSPEENGFLFTRKEFADYPHTWSNVLQDTLGDVEVINLSRGGYSMASIVTALSTWINRCHRGEEVMVFFQVPEPARKQLVATKEQDDMSNNLLENSLNHIKDYNIVRGPLIDINNQEYDIESHNHLYLEQNLYTAEWYQNIYNLQQICIANGFPFVWCSTGIPHEDIRSNLNDQYPNVMELDIRWDRNIQTIDPNFVSLTNTHMELGLDNCDLDKITAGCRHFTKEVQKQFAHYIAKSLVTHNDFWWQK